MVSRSNSMVEKDGQEKRDGTGAERVTNSLLMTIYRLLLLTTET